MAYGFNIAATIKSIADKVLQINLLFILYTDSKLLYNYLIQLKTIQEKQLIIDIICL